MRAKYRPGPLLGKGAYGCVIGCVDKATKTRWACKSIDVRALLKTKDGPNVIGRLRNEIGVMSYLAGRRRREHALFPCSALLCCTSCVAAHDPHEVTAA